MRWNERCAQRLYEAIFENNNETPYTMAYCRTFKSQVRICSFGLDTETTRMAVFLNKYRSSLSLSVCHRCPGPNWCPAKSNRDVSTVRRHRSARPKWPWANWTLRLCRTRLWRNVSKLSPTGTVTFSIRWLVCSLPERYFSTFLYIYIVYLNCFKCRCFFIQMISRLYYIFLLLL